MPTYRIQNGTFRISEENAAVGFVHGLPFCFLRQCSYNALLHECDMMNIMDAGLTAEEDEKLSMISVNLEENFDFILDNNYPRPMDPGSRTDGITNTWKTL